MDLMVFGSPCLLTPMASPTNDTQLPRHGHILPTLFKPTCYDSLSHFFSTSSSAKACSISRMASAVDVALTAAKILHILLYTNGGCQAQPSYDPVDMAAAIKST